MIWYSDVGDAEYGGGFKFFDAMQRQKQHKLVDNSRFWRFWGRISMSKWGHYCFSCLYLLRLDLVARWFSWMQEGKLIRKLIRTRTWTRHEHWRKCLSFLFLPNQSLLYAITTISSVSAPCIRYSPRRTRESNEYRLQVTTIVWTSM